MKRTSTRTRRSILVACGALAIAGLTAAPIWAASVCLDSYNGSCLASTTCNYYDDNDNWVGRVQVFYEC